MTSLFDIYYADYHNKMSSLLDSLYLDGDLVRPVAFRPVPAHSVGFAKRQSNSAFNNEFRPVNSLISMPAVPSAAVPTGPNIMKPKGMYQPSTSFCPLPQHPTVRNVVENEYDTVTDFYEKEKHSDVGSNGSDYSGFHGSTGLSKSIGHDRSVGSPGNTNKKSFTSSTSSSASRQSSGVHVTPSPSDSGIVDYESIIRDKENELREVRSTMEQNEEIIIKVYQEKERNYKEDVANLRARLTASEKGENALRTQLASCQRQTESMRTTIDELRAEKSELSRRCSQLEREVASLRQQQCTECVRHRAGVANGSRLVKESTPSDELREEVGQLRREVATLRDALSNVALLSSTLANGTPPGVTRTPSEPKISARDRLI